MTKAKDLIIGYLPLAITLTTGEFLSKFEGRIDRKTLAYRHTRAPL
jgi:adenosylmethionine-8-amino-7-oxononanoate aminotransferase